LTAYDLPEVSSATPFGEFSPAFAPEIVRIGVAFPLVPGA